jgi:hypothetical protein
LGDAQAVLSQNCFTKVAKMKKYFFWAVIILMLLFASNASAQSTNKINCELVTGEYVCEIIHEQIYEPGKALQIAKQVKSKTDTDISIGSDSLFVRYKDKTYEVYGYGTAQGTTQLLVSSTTVTDIRNELIVLLNGILLEASDGTER